MPDMEQCKKGARLIGGIRTKNNEYFAALYLRLSKEKVELENGEKKNNSVSIEYQREVLTRYAFDNGYEIYDEYIDDGMSGVKFNKKRKGFNNMIEDIKQGHVNMVLAGDLGRFGRNGSKGSFYRDEFFPEHGVRFVSLDGLFDSNKDEENDFAPFVDQFNEFYAKITSRKVKRSRKIAAEKGRFMGSFAPYGYRRSPEDKHKLIVDAEVAPIVKRIFEQFKNGDSARRIGDLLNQDNILPPQAHYYQYMGKANPYKLNAKTWCSSTILSILQKDVYVGHTTQGKRKVRSYKDDTIIFLPENNWIRVENTHEAIIDNDTFNAVRVLMETNRKGRQRRTSIGNEVSLFSNLLRCVDCGSKLTMHKHERRGKVQHRYRCSRYAQHANKGCTPHQITLEYLSAAVLTETRKHARLAKEDEDAFIKTLYQVSRKEQAAEVQRCTKEIAVVTARLAEIDELAFTAVDKNSKGDVKIPYNMLSVILERYDKEKSELEMKLPILTTALESARIQMADIGMEIETLKQHAEIVALSREIVIRLIRVIYISEPKQNGKEREYNIEIRYRFHPPQMITKKNTISPNMVSSEKVLLSEYANIQRQ
jgi:DNA invertase Pin-like site-specific DNA recombinase